jgi:hypothetical protein
MILTVNDPDSFFAKALKPAQQKFFLLAKSMAGDWEGC